MRGERSRTKRGAVREKRGDARVNTIEKNYGIDLRFRDDAHLETALKRYYQLPKLRVVGSSPITRSRILRKNALRICSLLTAALRLANSLKWLTSRRLR